MALLDEIEASLPCADDDLRSGAEAYLATVAGFVAPEGLGPLPEELLPRARHVLAAIHEAAERAAEARRAVAAELVRLASSPRSSSQEIPPPQLIDQDA